MAPELEKRRKKETSQEAFQNEKEKTKKEMLEKKQKIKDAHDRAVIAKSNKEAKKASKKEEAGVLKKKGSPLIKERCTGHAKERKVVIQETSDNEITNVGCCHNKLPIPKPERVGDCHQVQADSVGKENGDRKRQGKCGNCCGGLPGQGPGAPRPRGGFGGSSCCNSVDETTGGSRLRGGSDDDQCFPEDASNYCECEPRSGSVSPIPTSKFNFQKSSRHLREVDDRSIDCLPSVKDSPVDDPKTCTVERSRGGCGGCGGNSRSWTPAASRRQPCPPVPQCQRPRDSRAKISSSSTKGCCPCGGCGGPACSDNPSGGGREVTNGGCCGGSQLRGLPCKCKCQSCSSGPPLGGCGGRSCGRIYSCAGSGGGKCCFPRNSKRRSGADCCGGTGPNCGGCC